METNLEMLFKLLPKCNILASISSLIQLQRSPSFSYLLQQQRLFGSKSSTRGKGKGYNKKIKDKDLNGGGPRSSVNLSEPHLWYPAARRIERKFIIHAGPTNSGKTYQALQHLAKSSRGIYLAPLRLLAAEVCERLRGQGLRCDLITGQERDVDIDAIRLMNSKQHELYQTRRELDKPLPALDASDFDYSAFEEVTDHESYRPARKPLALFNQRQDAQYQHHISCTIEMAGIYTNSSSSSSRGGIERAPFDIAVIDEGQLLGDQHRGWAWTQALLGLPAKEIHICGSPDMVPIVKALVERAGDTIEIIHNYERLSPLHVAKKSLGSLKNTIKPGDCVIAFSRAALYRLKRSIERLNQGVKCGVVYGGLPPASRKEQARLFSDPTASEKVLVATDAIGMGLNLAIKRIIFSETDKFDGRKRRTLTKSELTQIAGRAGRYGFGSKGIEGENEDAGRGTVSVKEYAGIVTALNDSDLDVVSHAMSSTRRPQHRAGLFPTMSQLELLGLFVDYEISANSATLDGLLPNDEDCASTEVIDRYFDSIQDFAQELEQHLTTSGDISAARLRKLAKKRAYIQATIPFGRGKAREPLLVTLAELFRRFSSAAELDKSGLYRLCHLHEVVQLAEMIEDIPLSFSDRYTWCLAPVNIDNIKVLHAYQRYVMAFASTSSTVHLGVSVSGRDIPQSEEELLDVEALHNVCDLYQWLAQVM